MNRLYFSLLLILISFVSTFAQEIWESAIPYGLEWKADPRLTTYSTTLSELKTSNFTSESYENKKNNKFSYLSVCLT